jgi:arylsulfatase A-like enzyme
MDRDGETKRSRWRRSVASALLGLLAGCGGGDSGSPLPDEPSNIVLFTIDTLRTDRVGAHGSERRLTPHIDELAQKSAVFDYAVTPIATTTPAHASIFTGLYPRLHGVRWNGDRLSDDHQTLAERLADAGYETAAFIALTEMIVHGNLGQGFQAASDTPESPFKIRPGVEVNRLALRWLEEPREEPFFLWVHYYEVHSPYRLTPHARRRLGSYSGSLADGAGVHEFYSYGKPELPATPENRRVLTALYDGEVVEADRLIGNAVSELRNQGRLDNTVIIVTSDHGQLLGEHERVGHGFQVWEEALRVPLIVHDCYASEPRRIRRRVGLIDLFPTILEYARLPAPENAPGRSLVRDIHGDAVEETFLLAEIATGREEQGTVAVMQGQHKIVVSNDGTRAFDLEEDPSERNPLAGEHPPIFQRLEEVAETHRTFETSGRAVEDLDPEMLEHLRSLGYVR